MAGLKSIILTVSNDLSYDQRMERICSSLVKAGYKVTLVGRKRKNSISLDEKIYHQVRLKLLFEKGKLFYVSLNIRLFFYLLTHKFDIVCGVDLDTISACWFGAKLKRKKSVYDAHEWFPEVPEVQNRPSIKRFWERLEKAMVSRIEYCYTVSQGIVNVMKEKYGRSFVLIRNVPELREGFTADQMNRKIIYQGALNEGRALESLIYAVKYLDCELILAGEGDKSSDLKKLVKQLNLENKIVFTGYIQPDELRKLTVESKIGINLLEKTGGSYYHSLSNKFFDYMHAGIPSLTIDFPEYHAINMQYEVALLIDNTKPETITIALDKLLNDTQFYHHLKENCLIAKEQFNWQHEQEKLIEFYRHISG